MGCGPSKGDAALGPAAAFKDLSDDEEKRKRGTAYEEGTSRKNRSVETTATARQESNGALTAKTHGNVRENVHYISSEALKDDEEKEAEKLEAKKIEAKNIDPYTTSDGARDSESDEDDEEEEGHFIPGDKEKGAAFGFFGNESLRNIQTTVEEELRGGRDRGTKSNGDSPSTDRPLSGRRAKGASSVLTVPRSLEENQTVIDGLVWEEVEGVGLVHGSWMQPMTLVDSDDESEDLEDYEKGAQEFSVMEGISKESLRSLVSGMTLSVMESLWRRIECEGTLQNKWFEGYRRLLLLKVLLSYKSKEISALLRLNDLEESYLLGAIKKAIKVMRRIALQPNEMRFLVDNVKTDVAGRYSLSGRPDQKEKEEKKEEISSTDSSATTDTVSNGTGREASTDSSQKAEPGHLREGSRARKDSFKEHIIESGRLKKRSSEMEVDIPRTSLRVNGGSIVIIGGGLAGLTAAHFLQAKGFEVTLLEASDKLGGRLQTDALDGYDVQTGCETFHEAVGNPFRVLANTFGLEYTEIGGDGSYLECTLSKLFDSDGMEFSTEKRDASLLDLDFLLEDIDNVTAYALAKYCDDQAANAPKHDVEGSHRSSIGDTPRKIEPAIEDFTVSQAIAYVIESMYGGRLTTDDKVLLKWNLERYFLGKFGVTAKDLQLGSYEKGFQSFDGNDAIITSNTDILAKGLSKNVNVITSARVVKVECLSKDASQSPTTNRVRVTTDKGCFEGMKVVCTVPIPILQRGRIEFVPPLSPEKLDALNYIGLAKQEKLIVLFEEPFWPHSTPSFGYVPGTIEIEGRDVKPDPESILITNLYHTRKVPALVFHLQGVQAEDIAKKSEGEKKEFAMDILRTIFPSVLGTGGRRERLVIPEPKAFLSTNWADKENIGCSSVFLRGKAAHEVFPDVSEPEWEGNLLFAGDGTSQFFWGTVQGAMLSAVREVARISCDPSLIHSFQSSTIHRSALTTISRIERTMAAVDADIRADLQELLSSSEKGNSEKAKEEETPPRERAPELQKTPTRLRLAGEGVQRQCGWVLQALERSNNNEEGFYSSKNLGLLRPADLRREYRLLDATSKGMLTGTQEYSVKHDYFRAQLQKIARERSADLSDNSFDGEEDDTKI